MALPHPEFVTLLSCYNRLHRELESRLKEYKLTPAAFHALHEIAANSGGGRYPHTRAALARALGVTAGSVSVLVRRLVDAKLVLEHRLDARSVGLHISAKGTAALHGAAVAWEDTIDPWSQVLSATTRRHLLHGVGLYNDEAIDQYWQRQRERVLKTLRKHASRTAFKKVGAERKAARKRPAEPE